MTRSVHQVVAALAPFPVCEWHDIPADLKLTFVATCIELSGERSDRLREPPEWLCRLIVDGYDLDLPTAEITRTILADARFVETSGDLNDERLPLLAEMAAREPLQRLRNRVTQMAAMANDDMLQVTSSTPVCHQLGELSHLMNDRGRTPSESDLLPPIWCTNMVCRCEWRLIEGDALYKQSRQRAKARRAAQI